MGKWEDFLERLKLKSNTSSIEFNVFISMLGLDYGVTLSELDQETLIKAFSAK